MSNTDSFIDEVTEEVRRDRLFAIFRKYAWVGVLLVVGIVGGAIWTEWSRSQAEARAEAFGDALIDALDQGTPDERGTALAAVAADGDQGAILQLILSADPDGDKTARLAALDAVAADAALPVSYRDLAVLRRVMLAGADAPLAERRTTLQSIAIAGRPYRSLAEEQLAYLLIEEGNLDEAIAALQTLIQDQDATGALRARVGQVIVALGGTLPEPTAG